MANTSPGMPIWVDLGTSDLAAATAFYTELFGWTAHVSPVPEAGGYTIFNKDGKPAAGAGPIFDEGQPVVWSTYVRSDDSDATTAKVEAAGGKVLIAPFDVMDQGRMAVYTDPSGAAISVWEPAAMTGAGIFNEPGSYTWSELMTRDPKGAKEFYRAVFGWQGQDLPYGPVTYTMFNVDGAPAAGMMPMAGDMWPAELPPHWMVYFAVDDVDAGAARVTELGGTVSVAPTDIAPGRFAVVSDPTGAFFSIIKRKPDFRP